MDFGILIVRLIVGLALAAHGAQKLFGWFGGPGMKGTAGFMESLGWRPGNVFALLAGLGEFGGGLLTVLGFLNPIGPALIIIVMLNAMFSVHIRNGFFAAANGVELPLMNIAGASAIAFAGPGAISLDALFGTTGFSTPSITWLIVVLAVIVALLNLSIRRRDPVTRQAMQH